MSKLDQFGPRLLLGAAAYLSARLDAVAAEVQRDATAYADGPLIAPMVDIVSVADGVEQRHVLLLHDLPAQASQRAVYIGAAVAAVDGLGFAWLFDAFVRTTIDGPKTDALVAFVQTRDGFVGGCSIAYRRGPWSFGRVTPMHGLSTLVQVPTWPPPSVH